MEGKDNIRDTYESAYVLYEVRELHFNTFKSWIFLIKAIEGEGRPSATRLRKLTPKQMLQRLLIALAQVKPDNTLEDILKEIRKVAYSLFRANQITKKYTKI